MANCCKNNMVICQPIIGCCTEFWVEVPNDYLEPVIRVRITKNNNASFELSIVIEDGLIEIPLDELPANWFNSYGGPYTLQFIDPSTFEVIGFSWNGQYATGVQWDMGFGINDNSVCTLDIFQ